MLIAQAASVCCLHVQRPRGLQCSASFTRTNSPPSQTLASTAGKVFSRSELELIARLAQQHNVYVSLDRAPAAGDMLHPWVTVPVPWQAALHAACMLVNLALAVTTLQPVNSSSKNTGSLRRGL